MGFCGVLKFRVKRYVVGLGDKALLGCSCVKLDGVYVELDIIVVVGIRDG